MEEFLRKITPIVIRLAQKYQYSCPGYTFDDLKQEGFAVALLAARRWKLCQGRSQINTWAWSQIQGHFRHLSKPYEAEKKTTSYDALPRGISPEDIDPFMSSFFNLHIEDEPDEDENLLEAVEDTIAKLRGTLSAERFDAFVENMAEMGLSPISSASAMGVGKARISQIKRQITDRVRDTKERMGAE